MYVLLIVYSSAGVIGKKHTDRKHILYSLQITNIRFLKHIWYRKYNLRPPAMCFQAFIEIDVYLFQRLVTQTLWNG